MHVAGGSLCFVIPGTPAKGSGSIVPVRRKQQRLFFWQADPLQLAAVTLHPSLAAVRAGSQFSFAGSPGPGTGSPDADADGFIKVRRRNCQARLQAAGRRGWLYVLRASGFYPLLFTPALHPFPFILCS